MKLQNPNLFLAACIAILLIAIFFGVKFILKCVLAGIIIWFVYAVFKHITSKDEPPVK